MNAQFKDSNKKMVTISDSEDEPLSRKFKKRTKQKWKESGDEPPSKRMRKNPETSKNSNKGGRKGGLCSICGENKYKGHNKECEGALSKTQPNRQGDKKNQTNASSSTADKNTNKIPCQHCGKMYQRDTLRKHENSRACKNGVEGRRKEKKQEKKPCPECGVKYIKLGKHINSKLCKRNQEKTYKENRENISNSIKKTCPKCKKDYGPTNIKRHISTCKGPRVPKSNNERLRTFRDKERKENLNKKHLSLDTPQADVIDSSVPSSYWEFKIAPIESQTACQHCGAYKFQNETPGFCCRDGKVVGKICYPHMPEELKNF